MLVQSDQDLRKVRDGLEKARMVAIDTETSGLDWTSEQIVGISLAWREGGEIETAYIPVGHPLGLWTHNMGKEDARAVVQLAIATSARLYMHNANFDLHFLQQLGWLQPDAGMVLDTQVFGRIASMEAKMGARLSLSLLDMYSEHVGIKPEDRQFMKSMKLQRGGIGDMAADAVSEYAEFDAKMTLELGEICEARMEEDPTLADLWDVEARFVALLWGMERHGIPLNVPWVDEKIATMTARMNEITVAFMKKGVRNISSDDAVGGFLYDTLKIPVVERTPTGKRSVARHVLEAYSDHVEIAPIVEWRQLEKAVGSWLRPFREMADKDGYLHPDFDAAGTVSARISCRRPNLQAVPMSDKERLVYGSLSGIFQAPDGYNLLALDYKQADLRVATCYAKETAMATILASGEDPYTGMAEALWGKVTKKNRFTAKTISLATINSIGAATLSQQIGTGEDQAADILKTHRRTFPGFPKAARYCERYIQEHGYIPLWTGRKLELQEWDETHKAYSRLVQGGVAEMVKRAMLNIEQVLTGTDSRQILQIHDAVILLVSRRDQSRLLKELVECLEEALPLSVREKAHPPMRMVVSVEDWSPVS